MWAVMPFLVRLSAVVSSPASEASSAYVRFGVTSCILVSLIPLLVVTKTIFCNSGGEGKKAV
jgi:hypothetical protein